MHADRHILTLSCRNRPGIVAAVTRALFEAGGDIQEAHQFDDLETGVFFARIAFSFAGDERIAPLEAEFAPIAASFAMNWRIRAAAARPRVLILVSRFDHCLADLLYRWRLGELAMDIAGIASNYPRETFRHHDLDGIAFDHLPISKDTKPQQEAPILRIVAERRVELVVLARYMQVLSNDLSARLAGRCINIHHSFLPGFKGAKPYHQAYDRGVKLVGATAHYVTPDLDEGPIIEQEVIRIDHTHDPAALQTVGRDAEALALSRAVRWHCERRVLLNGHSTVVFR